MVEVVSNKPRHLFVASRDGLCGILCEDGEPQILPRALYGEYVRCLFSAGQSVTIATRDRGTWVSADGGETVTESKGLDGVDVRVLSGDGQTVFAGSSPADLFRSGDGGKSFEKLGRLRGPWADDWKPAAGADAARVSAIVVRGSRVVVGIADGGALLSESRGDEFRNVSDGLDAKVLALTAAAGDDQDFLAGTVDGLYRSPKLGTTVWRLIYRPRTRRAVTAIAVHPKNPSIILCAASRALHLAKPGDPAGADSSLFRSTDGGESFALIGEGFKPVLRGTVTGIVHVPDDPDRIFVGSSAGEIFESGDAGATFSMVASTLPGVLGISAGPGFGG